MVDVLNLNYGFHGYYSFRDCHSYRDLHSYDGDGGYDLGNHGYFKN